jgi:hypothetical protein
MDVAVRLLQAIKAAVPAVVDISIGTVGNSATVTVFPANQQAAAQATINAFDWSAGAHNTFENLQARIQADSLVDTDKTPLLKLLRAVAAVMIDEINTHSLKTNAILTAIDNGATLANVKTNILAVADLPPRTLAQAVTAIKAKIDAGTVD